eukprot:Gb_25934 [translate_table: standard]
MKRSLGSELFKNSGIAVLSLLTIWDGMAILEVNSRMNAGSMLNTCKLDGKWCFQWQMSELTKVMISSWSERMINHTGTETQPRLLWEAAVGNFLQWVAFQVCHQIPGLNPGQAVRTTKLEYGRGRGNFGWNDEMHRDWKEHQCTVRIDPCSVIANTLSIPPGENVDTGGAWLSSSHVVRLPVISWRKVRMTSSHHAPYALGNTRDIMAGTKGYDPARVRSNVDPTSYSLMGSWWFGGDPLSMAPLFSRIHTSLVSVWMAISQAQAEGDGGIVPFEPFHAFPRGPRRLDLAIRRDECLVRKKILECLGLGQEGLLTTSFLFSSKFFSKSFPLARKKEGEQAYLESKVQWRVDSPAVPGKIMEKEFDLFMHAPLGLGTGDKAQLVELHSCNWVITIMGWMSDCLGVVSGYNKFDEKEGIVRSIAYVWWTSYSLQYCSSVLPIDSGGIHVWHMPTLTEIFGDDSILQFGGGTLGHPWGNSLGAVANRVALEACVQARNEGRDLSREGNEVICEASKWSLELAASCEVWKEIKFEFDTVDVL